MRAFVLHGPGQLLRREERSNPRAGFGEAIVQLRCAALNHRDIWIQKGEYHITRYPVVPGADGSGVVCAIGDGVDARWLGREVVVNPGIGWGESELWARDAFETLGTPSDGTFAELLCVPATQLFDKPAHLDWPHAAALPLSGLTAYRALFSRGTLQAGERVLVTGAGGGVALFAIQFALAAGARVYATSGSETKLGRARELGVTAAVDYRNSDWPATLTRQAGAFDLIVDSACGPNFGALVELAAPGGRIVFFGTTLGSSAAFDMRKFFRKQLTLFGTKMGSLHDFAAMLNFVRAHRIVPVVDRVLSLADVNAGYSALDRGEHFGKIVFAIADGQS